MPFLVRRYKIYFNNCFIYGQYSTLIIRFSYDFFQSCASFDTSFSSQYSSEVPHIQTKLIVHPLQFLEVS